MGNEERIQLLYKNDETGNKNLFGAYFYHKNRKPDKVMVEEGNKEKEEEIISKSDILKAQDLNKVTEHLINNESIESYLENCFEQELNKYKTLEETVKRQKIETGGQGGYYSFEESAELPFEKSVDIEAQKEEKKKKQIIRNFKITAFGVVLFIAATVAVVKFDPNQNAKQTVESLADANDNRPRPSVDGDNNNNIISKTTSDYADLYYSLQNYYSGIKQDDYVVDPSLFEVLEKFDIQNDLKAREMVFEAINDAEYFSVDKLRTTENKSLQQEIVYGSSDKIKSATESNLLDTYFEIKTDTIQKLTDSYYKENENRSNLLSKQELSDKIGKILDLTTAYAFLERKDSTVNYEQLFSDVVVDSKFSDCATITKDLGDFIGFSFADKGLSDNSDTIKHFTNIIDEQSKTGPDYRIFGFDLPKVDGKSY